jgi:chromosome segregation protein
LQSLLGKQSSFESLERSILNIDNKKEIWFKTNEIDKRHRLSEKIQVSPGWETAVEIVLGDSLQAVYVESINNLKDSLETSIEDELFLVEKNDSEVFNIVENQTASLLAKVDGEDFSGYLKSILKDVLVENDLSSAFKSRKQLKNGQSIITKDGVWLGKDWIRITSTKDVTKGILKRKKELESLEIELKNTRTDVEKLEEKKSINEKSLRELEEQREKNIKLLAIKQNDHAELNTRMSNIEIQLDNITAHRERMISDLRETKDQRKLEKKRLSDSHKELNLSLVAVENNSKKRDELSSDRENKTIKLDSARETYRKYKDHAHEIAIKERAASTRLQSVIEGIQRLENQKSRLGDKKQQLFEAKNRDDNPEETLQKDLSVHLDLRLKVEKELSDSRNQVENLEKLMRDIEQKKNLSETEIQQERSALEQKKISAQDFETRSQTISEQIIEYGFNLTDLLLLIPDALTLDDLDQALEKISNRIQRLGPINLAAIDEFNTEIKRKQYLDKQNDDLEEALSTLEGAIRKIDKETRARFKETYDLVNISFQELFPKLFGGGKSYLELTSDDLLEAGVSIMARPPGKKNTTVHLLSGGEKAMTAIALVFSIFKLNPAPFCMLDEVDAPLDDSNVLRYAKIVEEISSNVQVVYISHNKNAMEMSNQLVGVTMHEAGVSRLVSVDIDQAIQLAEVR